MQKDRTSTADDGGRDSCSSALFDLHARQRERQLLRQQLQVLLKMSMWQILKYLY